MIDSAMTPIKASLVSKVAHNAKTGCWNWVFSKRPDGYGQVSFRGRPYAAHRVSYEVYRGNIPGGLSVLHKCDNPGCVNPDHLFLGTQTDNMSDMTAKGRRAFLRGSSHGRAKLMEADIVAIRSSSETAQALADSLGVSRRLVNLIRQRKIWKHV